MSKPPILITIAGNNSRFFPFNSEVHKALITLLGKPILDRTFEQLVEKNYQEVIVVLNPRDYQGSWKDQVIKDFPSLHFTFMVQEQPLGAGDAVLKAKDLLGEQFILSAYHNQTAELADQFLALNTSAAVAVTPTDRPWEYGIVTREANRATGLVEKPAKGQEKSNFKIQTTYMLNSKFLEILSKLPPSEYSLEIALNQLMQTGTVSLYETQDIPTLKYPWHLFDWQKLYFSHLKSEIDPTATIAKTALIDEANGPVFIGPHATIGHAAHIIGPAYIGANVLVGDFTLIRESSIEANATIGSMSDVARSIIMGGTSLHFAYVGDSIIGEKINIGAGLITANKRLDGATVPVTVKGNKINSDRRKLGVLIGNEANLGIRVSTMPGVAIGHHAVIYPSQTLYQNVEAQSTVQ